MQDRPTLRPEPALVTSRIAVVAFSSNDFSSGSCFRQKVPGPSGDRCSPFQSSRQGRPERNGRHHGSSPVADDEGLPRYVLVLPDAARHEVACAFGYFGESRLEIGKVDPVRVWEDLIAVENVK